MHVLILTTPLFKLYILHSMELFFTPELFLKFFSLPCSSLYHYECTNVRSFFVKVTLDHFVLFKNIISISFISSSCSLSIFAYDIIRHTSKLHIFFVAFCFHFRILCEKKLTFVFLKAVFLRCKMK